MAEETWTPVLTDAPNQVDADTSEETWTPMTENTGVTDPTAVSPTEGFYTKSRVDEAWNTATEVMKRVSNIDVGNIPSFTGKDTGVPDIAKAAAKFAFPAETAGAEMALDMAFTRPMAALTALAKDTPFDGSGRTGILDTIFKGFVNPEKYPPQEMVTSLIDAGMEPTSAAALATLGQFGFYVGAGEAIAGVVTTGKIVVLQKAIKNMGDAIQKANGAPGVTVQLKPEIAKVIAENVDIATVVDLYARSKGAKLCRGDGTLRITESAKEYGEVVEQEYPNAKIIARDGQGGVLLELSPKESTEGGKVDILDADIPRGSKVVPLNYGALDNSGRRSFESVAKDNNVNVSQIRQVNIPLDELNPKYEGSADPDEMGRLDNQPAVEVTIGKNGKFKINDGNHRISAAQEQGYTHIPAWVIDKRPKLSPTEGGKVGAKPPVEPPIKPPAEGGKPPAAGDEEDPYVKVVQMVKADREAATPVKDAIRRTGSKISYLIDKAFVPLSTRLLKIAPQLMYALRDFEFRKGMGAIQYMNRGKPMLEGAAKLSEADFAALGLALANRDVKKANEIIAKNGLEKEFAEVHKVYDDLHAAAETVGLDMGYIEDYWPRRVADAEGLLNYFRDKDSWSPIKAALEMREKDVGYLLTDSEKADFISKLLRGHGATSIWLRLPANARARLIDVITPEMYRFYKPFTQAFIDYVEALNMAIETRRFFGKDINANNTHIGEYVRQLVEDEMITVAQESKVREIIAARFNEKGSDPGVNMYKNIAYIYTMNSPINALSQLPDLAFPIYKNGIVRTVQALFSKKILTKEDVGIGNIVAEFSDSTSTGRAVTQLFRMIGLDKIDRLGKETLINSSLQRLFNEAQTNPELGSRLEVIFGDGAPKVLSDLKNRVISDEVKFLTFCDVLDFQPTALSEMPEGYVTGGNWRIAYMLKSYSVKVLDVYHREVFEQMKTDPVKGIQNLIRLTLALAAIGAPVAWLKDFILGKTQEFTDYMIQGLIQQVGFSKYTMIQARKDGIVRSLITSLLPPIVLLDDIQRDIQGEKDISDWRVWSHVPLVGTFFHWWFGGGNKSDYVPFNVAKS